MIHPIQPQSNKRSMPFNSFISHLCFIAALFGVVVLTDGCAVKQQTVPPKPSPEAARFLDQLAQSSRAHTALKGIGHFKVDTADRAISGRLAWVAKRPDKLRLTIIDPAGWPAALLVTNGETVWLDLRSEGKQYIKSARRFSLKRLVGIDVTLDDVIEVLLGGIPIRPYHAVEMSVSEKVEVARFLSADERPVTILSFQPEPFFVTQADYYDRAPAFFLGLTRRLGSGVDATLFPKELDFQDQARNRFYLRVDRFWVDPELKTDLFHLDHFNPSPPENSMER